MLSRGVPASRARPATPLRLRRRSPRRGRSTCWRVAPSWPTSPRRPPRCSSRLQQDARPVRRRSAAVRHELITRHYAAFGKRRSGIRQIYLDVFPKTTTTDRSWQGTNTITAEVKNLTTILSVCIRLIEIYRYNKKCIVI